MAIREHWACPYCGRNCTLGDLDIRFCQENTWLSEDHGPINGGYTFRICPSADCRKIAITGQIFKSNNNGKSIEKLYEWQLTPEANTKPFPEYIPQQLRDDYFEACLTQNKSAKASATLSRRCLQGIIRDFWNIKKKNLFEEVAALEDKVDATTWEAIDSVRKVGNIGAHMEQDVNVIIDVDADEAGLLIWLIETLFEEWYIERYNKEEKMKKISEIAKEKARLKIVAKTAE